MAEPLLSNPDPDAPSLVGGEYGAPAFQSVEQPSGERTFENVPRATMVAPPPNEDYGPFADLVQRPNVPGNIDLNTRPIVRNSDGSFSTVRTIDVQSGPRTYLLPTVSEVSGGIISNREAIDQFRKTGQHLGGFARPEDAEAYALQLHNRQAQDYGAFADLIPKPPPSITPASDAVVAATGQIYGSSGPTTAEAVGMEKQFQAAHPTLYGVARGVAGMIPTPEQVMQAGEEVNKASEHPVASLAALPGEIVSNATEMGKAARGDYGPEAQAQTITGAVLTAAPLLHLPFAKGVDLAREVPTTGPRPAVEPAEAMRPPPETPAAAEKIVASAFKLPSGEVVNTGALHGNAPDVGGEPGFITSSGRFVGREEAGQIATGVRQPLRGEDFFENADIIPSLREHPIAQTTGDLFQEYTQRQAAAEQPPTVAEPAPAAPAGEAKAVPRVSEPPLGGETKYMHPSERPEVPKITEVPPEHVPPEPESNDWTTATEPIEKQAGKLRLKGNTNRGYSPLINDVAEFGYRIYERGVDFARWSAEMIRHLGEKIRPHLRAVWDSLSGQNILPRARERGAIGYTGGEREITKGKPDIVPTIPAREVGVEPTAAERASVRKARQDEETQRFRKLREENPAEYQRMLAEAARTTKEEMAKRPKEVIPKWSNDKSVAKYLAEDVAKKLVKDHGETPERAAELAAKHLEDAIEAHRADNEGEGRLGSEFWEGSVDELAGAVLDESLAPPKPPPPTPEQLRADKIGQLQTELQKAETTSPRPGLEELRARRIEKLRSKIATLQEEEGQRLRLKADKEGGFVDLQGVADFGQRIYQKGMDFAKWSAEMVRHLGEKIKPHLQAVWDFVSGKHFLPGTGESGGIGKTGRRKAAFGAKLLPGYSELDALTGKRSAKLQKSTADVERITKEFKKVAKTPKVENAMSAWAEAQGDLGVLKQQEGLAKGKMMKQAARDAQKLTPEQQALALKGRQTFDIMGKRVAHYGMLNNFRQNYVPHLFDVGMRLTGVGSAKLQSKFKFAKAAKYQSFFEADQAGLKPKTMEMGKLLGLYTEHANQLIADRQFVQGAQTARSEAGEPLAIPRGRAGPVQSDSGGQAVLVNPHSFKTATDLKGNPVDQLKYRVDPDQPALRKWLFAGKDTQGKPIFMEDDLAIHPELAKRLKAMTGRSRIRQWYDEPTSGGFTAIPKAIVKNLDVAQAVMKREMFGLLAPFHQVQEGTHAIGHTVNPLFNIPKMGKLTPEMVDAAEHGLILKSERGSQAAAMEGVGGKGQFASQIARKFGGPAGRKVADVMDGYQDFLFEHYIPGLKFKTYEHMLPRNMKLYSKELASGEVTPGDVKMLTAQQANAAYGKLNLALLDRSPTLQHILQGLLIAPDFLEARGKFVGQAAKSFMGSKAGQEQLRAIAVLSMANAGMAYVITKGIGGEWDPKRPFEVQNADGTRSYFMRSVPEDFARLVLQGTDKRREFVSARINPLVNTAYQVGVSGRNYRGEKISAMDSLWELVNNYVPIIARSLPGLRNLTQTSRDSPISPLERLAGSLGVKVNRSSPITKTYQLAHDWKIAQGIPPDTGTYPVSKYQQMRYALEDNNQEKAADEFQKLLDAAGGDRKKVLSGFHESLNHPFTESMAMDKKFRDSLDGPSRAIYDAAKDRRHEIMRRFNEMKALEVRAVSR